MHPCTPLPRESDRHVADMDALERIFNQMFSCSSANMQGINAAMDSSASEQNKRKIPVNSSNGTAISGTLLSVGAEPETTAALSQDIRHWNTYFKTEKEVSHKPRTHRSRRLLCNVRRTDLVLLVKPIAVRLHPHPQAKVSPLCPTQTLHFAPDVTVGTLAMQVMQLLDHESLPDNTTEEPSVTAEGSCRSPPAVGPSSKRFMPTPQTSDADENHSNKNIVFESIQLFLAIPTSNALPSSSNPSVVQLIQLVNPATTLLQVLHYYMNQCSRQIEEADGGRNSGRAARSEVLPVVFRTG